MKNLYNHSFHVPVTSIKNVELCQFGIENKQRPALSRMFKTNFKVTNANQIIFIKYQFIHCAPFHWVTYLIKSFHSYLQSTGIRVVTCLIFWSTFKNGYQDFDEHEKSTNVALTNALFWERV